jgi:predicted PhzF superfamily epimerase YddE/YHI9
MRIPLYQVDAFADGPFTGNPAAVCPLEGWLPAETMQAIAAENNLPETAFLVAEGEAWRLRWFTAAHVVFTVFAPEGQHVLFRTEKAGDLAVTREGELLALDFPAWPPRTLRRADGPRRGTRARTGPGARRPRLSRGLRC